MKAGFIWVNGNNSTLFNSIGKFSQDIRYPVKMRFGTGIFSADLDNAWAGGASGNENGAKVKVVGKN